MTNFKFTTEVLKSLCSQDNSLSCVDKFINGVLKKKPEVRPFFICNVKIIMLKIFLRNSLIHYFVSLVTTVSDKEQKHLFQPML